jgi:hypothetical protein
VELFLWALLYSRSPEFAELGGKARERGPVHGPPVLKTHPKFLQQAS